MAYRLEFNDYHNYEKTTDQTIFVPIGLSANDSYIALAPKLDTGADHCLFDRRWGDHLGLDVGSGPKRVFRGLGGGFEALEHEVTIHTFDVEFTSRVYFTRESQVGRDLLGRVGWLEHFRIAIVHYDREMFLSPYEE